MTSDDRRPGPLAIDDVLDVAADAFVNDGFDTLTFRSLATRLRVEPGEIEALFETVEHLLARMLNREYSSMFRAIVDDIERDPLGGRLSRIYRYVLSAVYVRPLARSLFLMDRDGLNKIMRMTHGYTYVPQLSIRADFIERMKEGGTVRQDADAEAISAVVSAVSAGAALLAPQSELDRVVDGLQQLLERGVDTDQSDTAAGKAAFFAYALSLSDERRAPESDEDGAA